LAGGGLLINFSWLSSFAANTKGILAIPEEWVTLNGFLKITETGIVTIMSPNPEGGQNVKNIYADDSGRRT
jgi:isoquinoline 1-oxidoreductase beta subunit